MPKNRIISYNGRIELNRELKFSEAQTIQLFLTNRGIRITTDGRGLIWDNDITEGVELALAEVLEKHISKLGIIAAGVLHVVKPNKTTYDVVVIANKVKIFAKGRIIPLVTNI